MDEQSRQSSSNSELESDRDLISTLAMRMQVKQMEHTNFFGPPKHNLAPLFEAILAALVLEQPKYPRRFIYRCLLQIRAMRARGLRNSDIR